MSPNQGLPEGIEVKEATNPLLEKVEPKKKTGPGLRALRNQYKKSLRRTGRRTYTKVPTIQASIDAANKKKAAKEGAK